MSVLKYLILLIKRELNIRTPYKTSLSAITIKILFLSSLLISLYHESVNRGFCTKTNISICGDCLINMPIGLVDIFIKLINMPTKLTNIPIEVI